MYRTNKLFFFFFFTITVVSASSMFVLPVKLLSAFLAMEIDLLLVSALAVHGALNRYPEAVWDSVLCSRATQQRMLWRKELTY